MKLQCMKMKAYFFYLMHHLIHINHHHMMAEIPSFLKIRPERREEQSQTLILEQHHHINLWWSDYLYSNMQRINVRAFRTLVAFGVP